MPQGAGETTRGLRPAASPCPAPGILRHLGAEKRVRPVGFTHHVHVDFGGEFFVLFILRRSKTRQRIGGGIPGRGDRAGVALLGKEAQSPAARQDWPGKPTNVPAGVSSPGLQRKGLVVASALGRGWGGWAPAERLLPPETVYGGNRSRCPFCCAPHEHRMGGDRHRPRPKDCLLLPLTEGVSSPAGSPSFASREKRGGWAQRPLEPPQQGLALGSGSRPRLADHSG